jgi:hypothetical protein
MIVRISFSHYHRLLLHLKNMIVFKCDLVLELLYDRTPLSLSNHESPNLPFTVKAEEYPLLFIYLFRHRSWAWYHILDFGPSSAAAWQSEKRSGA